MKNLNKEKLLITLENKLSNIVVKSALSVNELFDKVVATLQTYLTTLRTSKNQLVKKKIKPKPWVTSNLLKCVLTKNKMCNELGINRNSLDIFVSYKRYKNVLNRSLKIAKSVYYRRVLSENRNDSKKFGK